MMRISSAESDGGCCGTLRGAGRGDLLDGDGQIRQHRGNGTCGGNAGRSCGQSNQMLVWRCSCCDGGVR
jgi:hypothetical protein